MMNELKNKFLSFMNSEYVSDRRTNKYYNNSYPSVQKIKNLKEFLESTSVLSNYKDFEVVHSVGEGRWAHIPFILIKKGDRFASKGVYIVYLFSEDLKRVYLTFNQAAKKHDDKSVQQYKEDIEKLKDFVRNRFFLNGFKKNKDLDLGEGDKAKKYKNTTIYYKEYNKENFPDDEVLLKDLKKILEVYNEFMKSYNTNYNFFNENSSGENDSLLCEKILLNKKQVVIYGPPGTGKTYNTKKIALELIRGNLNGGI